MATLKELKMSINKGYNLWLKTKFECRQGQGSQNLNRDINIYYVL